MGILKTGTGKTHLCVQQLLAIGLLICGICFTLACSKTVRVYQSPSVDLSRYERLAIIEFTNNADPSVSSYATQQFQDQIHAAQGGIPILQIGSENEVLRSVGADRLDFEAFRKIGRKYDVTAVFCGNIEYSDIETDVQLKSIRDLNANMNATLHATMSVQLYETDGGATVWSDSVSWKRNLGAVSVNKRGDVSGRMKGYHDAYRKLIPDMTYDVTSAFRGRYIRQQIADNLSR